MAKIRFAIYPFNEECMVFSDHVRMINEDYLFSEAACPISWQLSTREIHTSEGKYTVKHSPSEFVKNNDAMLVPDMLISKKAEGSIAREIMDYIPNIKELLYYGTFTNKTKQLIIDKCNECGCKFTDFRKVTSFQISEELKELESGDVIFDLIVKNDIPVLAVAGMWENTDKFSVALNIREKLQQEGYKVTLVGARGYTELVGGYSFPTFMYDPTVSEFLKPIYFSVFLKTVAEKEMSDIIIVTVPGAIQTYNDNITNRFGVLPFITFQGMHPDFFVLCSFYMDNPNQFVEMESELCWYRFGVRPDIIHMSNIKIDPTETMYQETLRTIILEREEVDETIENNYDTNVGFVMDLMDKEICTEAANKVIRKLTGDVVVVH